MPQKKITQLWLPKALANQREKHWRIGSLVPAQLVTKQFNVKLLCVNNAQSLSDVMQ